MSIHRRLAYFLFVSLVSFGASMQDLNSQPASFPPLHGEPPLIIAHRGASGYLPEHTLEAYARAIELGADFIEPDLVSTADGVLIARHEPWLADTTDVGLHPEFADRKAIRVIDGREIEDWFACDFTLAEIKRLRARQPFPTRDQSFNGRFEIPTFDEVIALAKSESAARGRVIGVYPETKHPTFHHEIGLPLEETLLMTLMREGWVDRASPVIVQSFEVSNLRHIRTQMNIRLVQLIGDAGDQPFDLERAGDARTYFDMLSAEGLAAIAAYADGIGIAKNYVAASVPERDWNGADLIGNAHSAGLFVHAYTFRNEARFRLDGFGDTPTVEYRKFYRRGIDGVFSDHPDTAREALTDLSAGRLSE